MLLLSVGRPSTAVDYRHENYSVSDLKAHLIFVTKYRQKVLNSAGLEVIENACKMVAEKMDFQILEFSGEADYVHPLVEYPPKLSISQMGNALKGVSSRRYEQARIPKLKGKAALWTPAHVSASVGGAPLEIMKQRPAAKKSRSRRAGLVSHYFGSWDQDILKSIQSYYLYKLS